MTTPGSVEHALELSRHGLAVFPVKGKHPLTPTGFKDAASGEARVRALWDKYGQGATGVGIATGAPSGIWALDVDVADGKSGDETVKALEDEHGSLPETWTSLTGSGGTHYLFAYDHARPVSCRAGVGPGVDVRGDGGYIVAPGSMHESGRTYEFELTSHPDDGTLPAEAPEWLVSLLARVDRSPSQPASSAELRSMLDGWTLVRTLSNGDEFWRRPGKSSGEHSAVLHPASELYPEGRLHVFSSSAPIPPGSYGTKVDLDAEADEWFAELREQFTVDDEAAVEEDEDDDGWGTIPLGPARLQGPPPPPEVLLRSDDEFLLYRGKLHWMYGPPESGKSWGAQIAAVQEANNHELVGYLDFENDVASFLERVDEIGLKPDADEYIVYKNPSKPLTPRSMKHLMEFLARKPTLVVVDGISNAMHLFGCDPLTHADAVRFEMVFLRHLVRSGAAVVCIDHAPKGDNPSIFGGQHKLAQVTGASFLFKVKEPFGRGMDGRAEILIMKDKPGYLRRRALSGGHVADLVIKSSGKFSATIDPPDTEDGWVPENIMNDLYQYIKTNPGATRVRILHDVGGKPEWRSLGLRKLMQGGFVADDLPGGAFHVTAPFGYELERSNALEALVGARPQVRDPRVPRGFEHLNPDDPDLIPLRPAVPTSGTVPQAAPATPGPAVSHGAEGVTERSGVTTGGSAHFLRVGGEEKPPLDRYFDDGDDYSDLMDIYGPGDD